MPSPFPGMDPYLEHPNVFPNLHDRLILYLEEEIQQLLPEPYFAKSGQRIWLEFVKGSRIPDVSVLRKDRPSGRPRQEDGGTAVAELPVKVTAPYVPWDEFHESFLEIYSKEEGEPRLVTAIEVLSPINKSPGEQARGAYCKKQGELLGSKVHLLEFDLLRAGPHTTAVPEKEFLERFGPVEYHICAHYFDQPDDFFIYPIQLPDKLPKVIIPLLPGDQAVEIELQPLFDRCYDRGPYRREINYAKDPPPPPLSPERLAWLKSVLAKNSAANFDSTGNAK
ncbi:MAG: DUF4058 family protein [Planctomycetaceae bacterium]|nr:DUF4058 family protein [Planctomycetaceae bacterium]